jgi:hypothetical protein
MSYVICHLSCYDLQDEGWQRTFLSVSQAACALMPQQQQHQACSKQQQQQAKVRATSTRCSKPAKHPQQQQQQAAATGSSSSAGWFHPCAALQMVVCFLPALLQVHHRLPC